MREEREGFDALISETADYHLSKIRMAIDVGSYTSALPHARYLLALLNLVRIKEERDQQYQAE